MLRKVAAVWVAVIIVLVSAPMVLGSGQRHHIIINLPEYQLYHYINDRLMEIYPISIGGVRTPTPITTETKRFEIYTKAVNPAWRSPTTGVVMPHGPNNPLGTRWLGLMTIDSITLKGNETWDSLARAHNTTAATIRRNSGLSANAAIVPGMVIQVHKSQGYGIHGTIVPSSIGTAVSLGCMRMHNADVERLFDNLPGGVRIPVEIKYQPVVEKVDPLTSERYLEVYHDVYKRSTDWSGMLEQSAQKLGFTAPGWLSHVTSQPFKGGVIISDNPIIRNNGLLLAVGSRTLDGRHYIPRSIAELILGEDLSHEYFYLFRHVPTGEYVSADLIEARTGKSFFYEQMHNTINFSITRLSYLGEFLAYNRVFVHPDLGPMISALDFMELMGGQGITTNGSVKGTKLGDHVYYTTEHLQKLGFSSTWDPQSGELTLSNLAITVDP